MRRPHVLLSAYACHPREGSEPGVGWRWLIGWLSVADVTLMTRSNNAESVRQGLEDSDLLERVTILAFDLSPIWLFIKRHLPGGLYLYYARWQGRALLRAIREGDEA